MRFIFLAFIFLTAPLAALAKPPAPETIGTWRFKKKDRPVKVITLGASVSAWPRGNYSQFLQKACKKIELVNKAKARIGGPQLKERFVKQVLRNRRLRLKSQASVWLMFQGGLNSIGTPTMTNNYLRSIYRKAHKKGIKVLGLTLGPWGNKKRWRGGKGLVYARWTRRINDFVLGKLSPAQALGRYARGRKVEGWQPGELPTRSVDVYNSALQDKEAKLWSDKFVRHRTKWHKYVQKRLKKLPKEEQSKLLEEYVSEARALPRQFMKKEYQAFDSIHPNMRGHRIMARTICRRAPEEWGCECALIDRMKWRSKAGGLVVMPKAP